jgi:hypothetical protein
VHKSLGVTITLGSVGLICDLSNSLNILRGEPDIPSIHILLEVLSNFAVLAKILG